MNNETAPADRRCVELTLRGQRCASPPAAGHDRCYIHGIYHALNDGRSSIDVPLLEDEPSILFVYSEVARALAHGAMPAANANGIIRCCRGAQRLLEEKWKRERFEEKRARSTEHPAQNAATAAPHPAPHQTDAAVPCNLQDAAETPGVDSAVATATALPSIDDTDATDASSEPNTLSASTSCAECDEAPQPWRIEPPLPVVPPPQFADAPEKSRRALERVNNQHMEAVLNRDRAIRARGGSSLDFHEKRGQGVVPDIREKF